MTERHIHLLGKASLMIACMTESQLEAVLAFISTLKEYAAQPKDDF